jgi:cytochrome P450
MDAMLAETSSLPPGPKGYWVLGNLPDFVSDLLGFLSRCGRDYGDIVSLRLGRHPAVLLNHPDQIEEVLVSRQAEFIKYRFFWRHVTRVFGNGLLTSGGDLWRRQHTLMAPAFRHERLALSADQMAGCARRLSDLWHDGEVRDIRYEMTRLTLEIVGKVLFGVDLGGEVNRISQTVDRGIEEVSRRFERGIFLPDWLPTPGNRRYMATVRDLDAVAMHILAERRASGRGPGDLLSALLQSRDSEGRPLDEKLLRDEVVTLLLAGHETTALALTWTLYLLARHPEIAERVEEEIDAVVGPERLPGAADLPRLRYLSWVITEAMRLYPPVYILGREAVRDVVVGGCRLSRGTICLISQWVVHRDPRFFPEPEMFKPERWDAACSRQLPRMAYFPFSGGPRICIGQPLAMMEAKLVLATLCQRFRFAVTDGLPIRPCPSVTLRPDPAVRLVVSRRVPAQATSSR